MSKATVRIPTPLRTYTAGADEATVEGSTVGEVLAVLGRAHPGLLERVLDSKGGVRPFVNVYLRERNVKALQGLDTKVSDGDVVSILPAVAGGLPAVAGGFPSVTGGLPAAAGGRPPGTLVRHLEESFGRRRRQSSIPRWSRGVSEGKA